MKSKPRPQRIREMCNLFEKANEKYHVKINMGAMRITQPRTKRHLCKTSCCHGGLFALAIADKEGYYFDDDPLHKTISLHGEYKRWNLPVTYVSGADKMAKFLGFKNKAELGEWAGKNKKLWGNEDGRRMFSTLGIAFVGDSLEYDNHDKVTIDNIIAHWRGVADRIEKNERTKS